jgi:hypothetical protein
MAEPTHGEIITALARIETQVAGLVNDVAETKEMVEAWQAVKTGGKVITWLAKVAAAIIGLVVFAKAGSVAMVDWGSRP